MCGSYKNETGTKTISTTRTNRQQDRVLGQMGVYYSTSARTIAFETGIPAPSVRRVLSELKTRGLVKKTPYGYARA